MSQPQIQLVFSNDDQAWIRREQIAVPKFWLGHAVAPLVHGRPGAPVHAAIAIVIALGLVVYYRSLRSRWRGPS